MNELSQDILKPQNLAFELNELKHYLIQYNDHENQLTNKDKPITKDLSYTNIQEIISNLHAIIWDFDKLHDHLEVDLRMRNHQLIEYFKQVINHIEDEYKQNKMIWQQFINTLNVYEHSCIINENPHPFIK